MKHFLGIVYIENDGTLYQRVCKAYQQDIPDLLLKLITKNWSAADAKYCPSK